MIKLYKTVYNKYFLFEDKKLIEVLEEIIENHDVPVEDAIVVKPVSNKVVISKDTATIIQGEETILIESYQDISDEIKNRFEIIYLNNGQLEDEYGHIVKDTNMLCSLHHSLLSRKYKSLFVEDLLEELRI